MSSGKNEKRADDGKASLVSWAERFVILDNLIQPLDFSALFDQNSKVHLDLGAGDGGFTAAMAERYPEINFLGVERLKGRAIKIAKKSIRASLPNLKVLRLETSYLMQWLVPAESLTSVHLLCPDPWPKRKHQHFRILQPNFISHVVKALKEEGIFHFATDHDDYFETGTAYLNQNSSLSLLGASPWGELPPTDFEKQWVAQGKSVHHVFYQKRKKQ